MHSHYRGDIPLDIANRIPVVDMNIKLCPSTLPITSMFTTECMCKQQQTSQYIIMGGQNRIRESACS